MIDLLRAIPARLRRGVYFGYVAIAFVLGGIDVALNAAGVTTDPTWLTVCYEVLKYASVPITAAAGINVITRGTSPLDQDKVVVDVGNNARMVAAPAEGRHKRGGPVPPKP